MLHITITRYTSCRNDRISKQRFHYGISNRCSFATIFQYHYTSNHISFGHGVSYGQGVIEGGVVISDSSTVANRVPIRPGMIITLEPGIYIDGEWGIRIENVYAIEEDRTGWMRFVPLTLIPYSRKMIDVNLLTKQELKWIHDYHQLCREKVNGGQWMVNEINAFN